MLTVAWDVDDVLNNLLQLWFENEWLPNNPQCSLKYDDLTENPPNQVIGISRKDYLASLDNFRLTEKVTEQQPVGEVIEWFKQYGSSFEHIALTAAPLQAAQFSARWVINNFGSWIRTFHFIPPHRNGQNIIQYDKSKADFLKRLNSESVIFIDDTEENVNKVKEAGFDGILMPRPWNSNNASINETLELLTERCQQKTALT